jgi:hypothetical protein
VTLTLPSSATLGSIQVLTQGTPNLDYTLVSGGSCTPGNAYAANATCTVEAQFAPRYPGLRSGAVVLFDNSGNMLATVYLAGIGSGPQTTFSAGSEQSIATGLFLPSILLDQNGNIYIAPGRSTEITQETPTASGYIQSTFSLNGRVGAMAIDGAGNFFVSTGGTLYQETRSPNGYVESTISAGLSQVSVGDVALDGNGNLYLVTYPSTGIEIVMETPGPGGYIPSVLFDSTVNCNGGGLDGCGSSLAVDASGNVYMTLNTQVLELSPALGSYTQNWIVSGLSYAAGIAVDTTGNLFVADTGNARVFKETPWNGSYIQTIVPSQPLAYPGQVAVDQTGNVYIVDSHPQSETDNLLIQQVLKENYSTPPSLTFAATSPGVTSGDSPRTVVVTNNGTAPLNFSGVTYSSNFPETAQLPGACTPSTSLPAGANCALTINFRPQWLPDNDENPFLVRAGVVISTDTLNAAATEQEILANGNETRAANSLYISSTPNPSKAGSSVALTAAVAGAAAGPVPTGSLTFYSGATALATVSLTSGVASFSTSTLPKGTDTVTATYSGDSVYTSATSNSIAQVVGMSIPSVTVSSSTGSSYVGTPIQFTAAVAGVANNPSPTGTVTFSSGGTNLGSAPVVSGAATLPISFPTSGTQTVAASYSGDSNYVPAVSLNGVNATLTLAQVFGSAPALIAGSTVPVTVTIPSVATLTGISVLTLGIPNQDFTNAGGGTCSIGTAYAQGATCTVNVAFNPTHAGIHSGAVAVMDSTSSTSVVSTVYLQGTLHGPQLAFSSNPFNSLGSVPIYPFAWSGNYTPGSVAVDPGGNLFVAAVGTGVTKWTLANGAYTQTNLTTSAGGPGIAIDGSGNLFVACGATLCELSPQPDGSYSQTTAATGFNSLFGVAIDGAGNLYLTDSLANALYKETLQPDGTYIQSSIGTGWQSPEGLALDGSDDVAVTSFYTSPTVSNYLSVLEETLSGDQYSQSLVSSSISSPVSVTFDASGTLFVAGNTYWLELGDGCGSNVLPPAGGQGLWQETPESGGSWLQTQFYTGSSEQVILNDSATGDLYLVDTGLTPDTCSDFWGELYQRVAAQAAPVGFGSDLFGAASSPQAVSIYNQGDQPLQFSAIHFPTDFPETPGVATECIVGTPLPPAATCTLTAVFQPVTNLSGYATSRPFSESITLTTNSLSLPQQNISLSGTEVAPTTANPVFSPPAGTYNSTQYVQITDAMTNATILYTTDGTTPTASSQRYLGSPITVASTETLQAIAGAPYHVISPVASAAYTLIRPAATPVFSVKAGTYQSTQNVTITDASAGSTIFYTTDGTTPTISSQRYDGPIPIAATRTLQAVAGAPGHVTSAVALATYTITRPAATPVFSITAGTYTHTVYVSIQDATAGSTIYYTANGTTPTTSSNQYLGAIEVASTETLKAIAIPPDQITSAVASATYTITRPAATPEFSIAAGTYRSTQSVTITDATAGATFFYTTDGTTPTASSQRYLGVIMVGATETLKATAVAPGYVSSAVASATYTITRPAATPVFSITAGTYTHTVYVSIQDATTGSTIYYTANGTTPTTSSNQYQGAIEVTSTETLKAIAVPPDQVTSAVASATYTINRPAATPVLLEHDGHALNTH